LPYWIGNAFSFMVHLKRLDRINNLTIVEDLLPAPLFPLFQYRLGLGCDWGSLHLKRVLGA
jgi:hypothetical protein